MKIRTGQRVQYNLVGSPKVLGGCTVLLVWVWQKPSLGTHLESSNALKLKSKVLYCPCNLASGKEQHNTLQVPGLQSAKPSLTCGLWGSKSILALHCTSKVLDRP